MIHVQYGRKESLVFIDQAEYISGHASARSTAQWVSYMDLAAECQKKLRYNVNGQLSLEQLLMGLGGNTPVRRPPGPQNGHYVQAQGVYFCTV